MVRNIGELNKRITILRRLISKDEYGYETEIWEPVSTRWASLKDVSGREFFAAATMQMENITTFTLRWMGELDVSMRVRYRETEYDIVQINWMSYIGDYVEIKARKREVE